MPASAGGRALPATLAAATAIWPSVCANADGATMACCATFISNSSSAAWTSASCAPFFTICRSRCASNGWSLRRKLPMTSTRSSAANSAIDMPSQVAPWRRPSALKSEWRRRKSMFSPPRPRTSFCSRCISSSVACGETSAPRAAAPWSCANALELPRHMVERRLPVGLDPLAVALEHRLGQPVLRVETLVGEAVLVRQPALVDGLVLQRHARA